MSLNVKDPEARRLAKAIAIQTGESLTKVVIESLRERHARLEKRKQRPTLDEIRVITERTAKLVKRPYVDHADLLYDDHGLPK